MRDPNVIPGLEDEYTGKVGHEKAVHRTHFSVPDVKLRSDSPPAKWVKVGVGKWRRVNATQG